MKILEAAFFGYPSTDLPRSRKFYEGILGLKPMAEPANAAWIEYDLGNATLGLGAYPDWKPSSSGAIIALEVDDFDQSIEHFKQAGVPFKFEGMETPVCHCAMISDPDDNSVMIHKRKPGHV